MNTRPRCDKLGNCPIKLECLLGAWWHAVWVGNFWKGRAVEKEEEVHLSHFSCHSQRLSHASWLSLLWHWVFLRHCRVGDYLFVLWLQLLCCWSGLGVVWILASSRQYMGRELIRGKLRHGFMHHPQKHNTSRLSICGSICGLLIASFGHKKNRGMFISLLLSSQFLFKVLLSACNPVARCGVCIQRCCRRLWSDLRAVNIENKVSASHDQAPATRYMVLAHAVPLVPLWRLWSSLSVSHCFRLKCSIGGQV